MDTDQNKGDRNETKAALLGELESIKDLLSEEEMADIPLLDQPFDEMPELPSSSGDAYPDIPLLTNIPLLEETVSDEPLPTPQNTDPDLNESIAAALANINVDIDLTDEIPDSEEAPTEKSLDDDHNSLSDNYAGSPTDYNLNELGVVELEHKLEASSLDEEPLENALLPHVNGTADNEELTSESQNNHIDSTAVLETVHIETESQMIAEDKEEPLPVGVLPGQRNLFDDSLSNAVPLETIQTQPFDTSERAKKSDKVPTKPRAKVEQAKGENPFLPKHIRERLHTTKSLMEVIKEVPLDTQAVYHNKFVSEHPEARLLEHAEANIKDKLSEHDKLDILINEIIAEFMPKIEAELHARLTSLATSKSDYNQKIQIETEEGQNDNEVLRPELPEDKAEER